ncbi:stealth family protein [Streptomyces sp. NPDC058964]|uniref:stealth family protein n=1 Tax=Streptomyces sp. NPDC058964 TaxID=3346681 RepID=UPI0036CE949C
MDPTTAEQELTQTRSRVPALPRTTPTDGSSAKSRSVNAEGAALVRAYRALMPNGLRRFIARRYSPESRRKLKALMSGAFMTAALRRARCSVLALLCRSRIPGAGAGVTWADGRARIAFREENLAPHVTRARNLSKVTAALERSGIDYFCVRGRERNSTVVAVHDGDRRQALGALRELCDEDPGYLVVRGARGTRVLPAYRTRGWRAGAKSSALGLFWFYAEPGERLVLGPEHACEVEFWAAENGALRAPRRNAVTDSVPVDEPGVRAPLADFTAPAGLRGPSTATVRTRKAFTALLPGDITFPVDAVYTWVDGSDPAWLHRRSAASSEGLHAEAANAGRYANHDELRYSLRSLAMHAPWIRDIYLVTDDQTPPWLDTSQPGITVVSHREIFSSEEHLPTFNSHAIESQLHHIDGLSEHFLYFNDDVFLGDEVLPEDFFLANGLSKFFPSPALVPLGPPDSQDPPVSLAGKNNRAIVQERFGTMLVQKMRHVPHPLRRSILDEIEKDFPEQHQLTSSTRFRGPDDLAVPSSLYHYYAFHTQRALPSELSYVYLDVSLPNAANRLDQLLLSRDKKVFCLNDTCSTEADFDRCNRLLRSFLDDYFPVPSRFEKHA